MGEGIEDCGLVLVLYSLVGWAPRLRAKNCNKDPFSLWNASGCKMRRGVYDSLS